MDFDREIKNILFAIGKDIKIHKIDKDNMIIEMDYEKYVLQFKRVIQTYLESERNL